MATKKKTAALKAVEALLHDGHKRKSIPTAEFQSVMKQEEQKPVELRYPRNKDLDPQLVWRGKDEQDWSDLVVHAPPLYIQEKVHPKVLIDELRKQTEKARKEADRAAGKKHQLDLFAAFNDVAEGVGRSDRI